MKKREKELFKSLCSFKEKEFDESLLDAATPAVLGHLFFNRMQAVAFGTLEKHGLLGKVNRECHTGYCVLFEMKNGRTYNLKDVCDMIGE